MLLNEMNPMSTIDRFDFGVRKLRWVVGDLLWHGNICKFDVDTSFFCITKAKMSKAKVLYINITGVSSEILKNLVLAGIKASLCDGRPYPEAVVDTPSFFLSPTERLGNDAKKVKYSTVAQALQPVVEELNPLLGTCEIETRSPHELPDSFFGQFSIVIASRLGMGDATRISNATIAGDGKFFLVDCFGMYGASVIDLGESHTYRPEIGSKLLDPRKIEPHVPLDLIWKVPLKDATNRFHKTPLLSWAHYRSIMEYHKLTGSWPTEENADDFSQLISNWIGETSPELLKQDSFSGKELKQIARMAGAEVSPVCAVVGGIIGNEVIKAISGKGEPANNTILFDGVSCKAWTFLVQEKFQS